MLFCSGCLFFFVFFFFFQAEDGIRDADVTGVQTCALPISRPFRWPATPSSRLPAASRWRPCGRSPRPASTSPPSGRSPTRRGPSTSLWRCCERDAVVLAHNYQVPEVQDVADYVGDSLGLSHEAAATDASAIVFCGVHFMAETAAILSPDKTVLIPDPDAGCSLAASITGEQLREWKAQHSGAVVVSYVNTTAEVKAESDYCCTSGNAKAVIEAIPQDREILFLPDMFLGIWLERVTGRKLTIWLGECHVHAGIRPQDIERWQAEAPDAELLVHPECGCASQCMAFGNDRTHILSTEGMVSFAKSSPKQRFLVATETGILHRLNKEAPGKRFEAVSERAICKYMKMITLEKLRDSLRDWKHVVTVEPEIADSARGAIERMVAIS